MTQGIESGDSAFSLKKITSWLWLCNNHFKCWQEDTFWDKLKKVSNEHAQLPGYVGIILVNKSIDSLSSEFQKDN